jgi:hypothetical protein
MRCIDIEPHLDKLVTVWVGSVMYPGKLTWADNSTCIIESHQYTGQFFIVNTDSVTAVSGDTNMDTVEKFQEVKKAREDQQKADADEYRRIAAELEKDSKV